MLIANIRSYSERISFYLQKIFSDEATGRTGLDFYTALNHERRESEQIQQRFPDALKVRLLRSAQFRARSGSLASDF
jgi:bromodomain adjacent to zinc finger domain protein 1A